MDSQELISLLSDKCSTIITTEFMNQLKSLYNKCYRVDREGRKGSLYIRFTEGGPTIEDGLLYLSADSYTIMDERLTQSTRGKISLSIFSMMKFTEIEQVEYDLTFERGRVLAEVPVSRLNKFEYLKLLKKLDVLTSKISSTELIDILTRLSERCIRFTYPDGSELWLRVNSGNQYRFEDAHIVINCDRILIDCRGRVEVLLDTYQNLATYNTTGSFEEISDEEFNERLDKWFN